MPTAKVKKVKAPASKRDTKKSIMGSYGVHDKDTGSPYVQVALITDRIESLTEHLKTHKKDKHSRRGLLNLVGARRRHLMYIRTKDRAGYDKLLEKLDIRK